MTRPILTYDLAMAAAQDAGNRSMRAGGRVDWNDDDWNAMCAEFDRLIPPSRVSSTHLDSPHPATILGPMDDPSEDVSERCFCFRRAGVEPEHQADCPHRRAPTPEERREHIMASLEALVRAAEHAIAPERVTLDYDPATVREEVVASQAAVDAAIAAAKAEGRRDGAEQALRHLGKDIQSKASLESWIAGRLAALGYGEKAK